MKLNIFAKIGLGVVGLTIIGAFLSYRILDVPTGLTVDEAAFGYNAVLLSRTLHDQNGRFLPVFVLSIDGKDWRQPVTQYYLAGFFKIFGPSVLNLRLSSVVITLLCMLLIYFLVSQLINPKIALISIALFLTTPIVLMHTHLALDNIMPVPFTLLWLINLYLFSRRQKSRFLIFAALSLGFGFYSYKGMRATVPVWALLTLGYLSWDYLTHRTKSNFKSVFKYCLIFSLSILPFFAVIPLLEQKYAGAIFDRQKPQFDSLYAFLYPYFSSYDPSFLFIHGDELIFHSTFRHGMMLLTSLPLFLIGLFQAWKGNRFWRLVILAFFTAPLLYGYVGSIHRASRLLTLVPEYVLICSIGVKYLLDHLKINHIKTLSALLVLLFAINFIDFVSYYWYIYPKESRYVFGDLNKYQGYRALHDQAISTHRQPYILRALFSEGESAKFYESIYFPDHLDLYENEQIQPTEPFILLHDSDKVEGLTPLNLDLPFYHLFINNPTPTSHNPT